MNLLVPHTVLIISALRVRLDWLRPARILGPGVFHFEGDLRPRLRTLSQTKDIARGFIEVRFMSGDTIQVLKDLLAEAHATPSETPEAVGARHARVSFIYGLAAKAGVDLASNVEQKVPVANLESSEAPPAGEPMGTDDAADAVPTLAEAFSGIPGIPEVPVETSSPAGDSAPAPATETAPTATDDMAAAALGKKKSKR